MSCLTYGRGNKLLFVVALAIEGCGGTTNGSKNDDDGSPSTDSTYTRATEPAPTETNDKCWTTSVTGTLNGNPVDLLYDNVSGSSVTSNHEWSFDMSLGNLGHAILRGSSDGTSNFRNLSIGEKLTVEEARLILPTELLPADSYVCVTGTSFIERASNHYAFNFGGVALMPDCSTGTPVQGGLSLCLGSTKQCDYALTGQIEDQSYDLNGYAYSTDDTGISGTIDDFDIRAMFKTNTTKAVEVKGGFIRDPDGAVYCVGAGSKAEPFEDTDSFGNKFNYFRIELSNLTLIGDCSQVVGTDEIVVRSCTIQ
jgi:hypothetical protein